MAKRPTVNLLSNNDRALLYTLLAGQETIMGMLIDLTERQTQMAADIRQELTDLEADLAAETDAVMAVSAGFDSLAAKYDEIIAQLPTSAQKQQLMDLSAAVKQHTADLAAAAVRNTRGDPAGPAPDPTPGP